MKLEFPEIEIKRSGTFKQANFDFGDKRIIMNILRSKMYSRPIYVICQEIMSNARDANREAGRGDQPIEITLPNDFSDQIIFKDCGPGISPDRMENVFIRYGNSTKRVDNSQTGGFGLGAKTPFSYSDSFNITTVTNEPDGKRVKRTYIAYIDESQLGAMTLVQEIETDEETGTAISMGVKRSDNSAFYQAVQSVAAYWNPKPVIKGVKNFAWENVEFVTEGSGWALTKRNYSTIHSGSAIVLVDSIPYSLRNNGLFPNGHDICSHKDFRIIQNLAMHNTTVLFFNVGELAVTANREDLDYQPEVIEKIHSRLIQMTEEARKSINDMLVSATSLWDASIDWRGASSTFSQFGIKPEWQGLELLPDRICLMDYNKYEEDDSAVTASYYYKPRKQVFRGSEDVKVSVFELDVNGDDVVLVKEGYRRKTVVRYINNSRNWFVVEDEFDNEKPDRARVLTILKGDEDIKRVAVVSFRDQASKDYIEEEFNWSKWNVKLLAAFPKTARSKVIKRGGYKIYKVKKFVKTSSYGGGKYDWAADTRTTADSNGGTYAIIKNGEIYIGHGIIVTKSQLAEIKQLLGVEIHGFLHKWAKKDINPAWVSVYDRIKEEMEKIRSNGSIEYLAKHGTMNNISTILDSEVIKHLDVNKINPGMFRDWLVTSRQSEKFTKDGIKYNELAKCIKKPTIEIGKGLLSWYKRGCLRKYSMLSLMDRHIYRLPKKAYAEKITTYVNTIDK